MEPVGSTYAASLAADVSMVRISGEVRNRIAGSVPSPVPEGHSGRIVRNSQHEQQGVQLSKQPAEEFSPYTPGGVEKSTEPRSGMELPGGAGAAGTGNAAETQDPQVQAAIAQLKATEEKVKAHEAAHKSAGGTVTGPVSYTYTRGPDGRNYITGGEVPITISSGKTPQETISRMQQVIRAALAPADPSPQDRAVAAQATAQMQEASQQLAELTQQSTPGAPPAVAPAPENPADSRTARDVQRAYGNPAATGQQPEPPGVRQAPPSDFQNATSDAGAGRIPQAGLMSTGITGFGSSRPVSYYA